MTKKLLLLASFMLWCAFVYSDAGDEADEKAPADDAKAEVKADDAGGDAAAGKAEEVKVEAPAAEEKKAEAPAAPAEEMKEEKVPAVEEKKEETAAPEEPKKEEPAPAAEEKKAEAPAAPAEEKKIEAAEEKKAEAPAEVKKEEPAPAEENKVEAPVAPAEEKKAEAPAPAPAEKKPEPKKEEVKAEAPAKGGEKECETCNCGDMGRKLLLYIPNLFLDLNDAFTFTLGVGAEAAADVRITRYCQLGGAYGSQYFLAKDYMNQYGGGYLNGWNYGLIVLADEQKYLEDNFCTVKDYIIKSQGVGIPSRNDDIYKRKARDFWSVGATAGWLVLADFQMHPVEFADFVCGIFFIDLNEDDIK